MSLASSFNLLINSSTSATLTPPALLIGSSVFKTSMLLETSIPKDSKSIASIGFFLAWKKKGKYEYFNAYFNIFYSFTFIMLGKVANLGLFNLKSQVITPGSWNYN